MTVLLDGTADDGRPSAVATPTARRRTGGAGTAGGW